MALAAREDSSDRRSFVGGSDARILMSTDEAAVVRLWQEKRGEIEPEDLSRNLLVQFGHATEDLNRRWFEQETGRRVDQVQRFLRHPKVEWMGATLDGMVPAEKAVFEAKFMLPWSFSEEDAPPTSTWPSSSTTCSSAAPGGPISRS